MNNTSQNNPRWNLVYLAVIAFLVIQIAFYYFLTEYYK